MSAPVVHGGAPVLASLVSLCFYRLFTTSGIYLDSNTRVCMLLLSASVATVCQKYAKHPYLCESVITLDIQRVMCISNLLHVFFWQFSQKYECFNSQILCSIDLPLQTHSKEPHISYRVMQKNGIRIGQQREKASF